MDTKQKLEIALKDAMRSRDDVGKRTLRLALSSIKLAEIDQGEKLNENHVLGIIQKEIKTRQESIESAKTGERNDLLIAAEAEIKVLETFLPAQLAEDEITELASIAIKESAATSLADMGKVMKLLVPAIQGRATNKKVSDIVRNLLNG